MIIDSQNLIVSVNSSSYGDYNRERLDECCITTEIQHTFKTLKNPESESVFPPSYESYTASHNVALLISEATKKNNFNSRAVNMDHEKLHAFSCVCASFFVYPPWKCQKNEKWENTENKGSEKLHRLKHTRIDSNSCAIYIHKLISININQYQLVYKGGISS
jgi:hypothetical protein